MKFLWGVGVQLCTDGCNRCRNNLAGLGTLEPWVGEERAFTVGMLVASCLLTTYVAAIAEETQGYPYRKHD